MASGYPAIKYATFVSQRGGPNCKFSGLWKTSWQRRRYTFCQEDIDCTSYNFVKRYDFKPKLPLFNPNDAPWTKSYQDFVFHQTQGKIKWIGRKINSTHCFIFTSNMVYRTRCYGNICLLAVDYSHYYHGGYMMKYDLIILAFSIHWCPCICDDPIISSV